ncbi:MAG TPA: molybdopterin-dependent oxidoreductase [Bryobacteraceae bacterium]|nr:molybdopterin-dependent oxidoreductase [Bryobacteraceae bacterium]
MTDQEISRITRRSLLTGGIAALAGTAAWKWLRSRPADGNLPWPLRVGLRINEEFSNDYSSDTRLARTFPASAIQESRENGDLGLDDDVDPNWKLNIGDLSLSLADIKALPKVEMITQLKCIEGWSVVVKWGGARFRDFVAKYAPNEAASNAYVALATPDREYYVGLDKKSAMHPQTLLAYEMNGAPLTAEHGAPLRLAIPLKYGIKNLKQIGTIAFSNTRPPDYWAERGYDWYAGF